MDKGQPEPAAPPYPGPPLNPNYGFTYSNPEQQPPYQYSPQQPAVLQTVTVQQLPTFVPVQMMCPHCQTTVTTEIKYQSGAITWLACALTGLFLCWPCCCIPFCVNSCKDAVHYCPNCRRDLVIYKRR